MVESTMVASVVTLVLLARATAADPAGETNAPHASVAADAALHVSTELDPAAYLFRGYSAHLLVDRGSRPDWTVGVAAFGVRYPDFLIDLVPLNSAEGWQVRTEIGANLYVDRTFMHVGRSRLYVGGIAVVFANRLARDGEGAIARFGQLAVGARIGYRWFPFARFGLYVNPWLALTYATPIWGSRTIGGETYAVSPLAPFPGVHVGYRF